MSPCHQCYAATVDRQMRMVAILTSSSNIALIGIWMARHPGFVVSVGYHGFIGLVQPRQRWGFFQSVCPVYGGLLRVFLCLKDKILFESTSGPSFAGMVLVDISWYSNKLPTNHWPPVTWKISKCHDLKADFHLPAGFTAFSLWNTVSHLAWGQYLKQPEEANGKEIFRQAQFFQRLLEFGAASFSVFFLCENLCITSITNPIHAVCFQCWRVIKHTKARWSRWQRAKKAITRSSITRTPR